MDLYATMDITRSRMLQEVKRHLREAVERERAGSHDEQVGGREWQGEGERELLVCPSDVIILIV